MKQKRRNMIALNVKIGLVILIIVKRRGRTIMYEDLIWGTATALADVMPVYLLVILILDWLRSILFYNR